MIPCRRTATSSSPTRPWGTTSTSTSCSSGGSPRNRSRHRVRHPWWSRPALRTDAERRRTGGDQRGHDPSRLPGFYEDDPDSAVRRGGAEPEPDPGRRARRTSAFRTRRSGCTRARPPRSRRTCRTTSRHVRSTSAPARPPGRSSTTSTRTAGGTTASPAFPDGGSGPTTTATGRGRRTSRPGSRTHKVSTSSTTSGAARTRCARRSRRARRADERPLPTCLAASRTRPLTGGTGSAPGGQFQCGWGPIDTATTTYARGKDFGNFQAAVLTLVKQLFPTNDPGRFDLLVDSVVLVAAAGDGAKGSLSEAARYVHGVRGRERRNEPGRLQVVGPVQARDEACTAPRERRVHDRAAVLGRDCHLHLLQRPQRHPRDRDRQDRACDRDGRRHAALHARMSPTRASFRSRPRP